MARPRGQTSLVLRLDGANYNEWRVLISSYLDSNPYALDVTVGNLIPPPTSDTSTDAKIQRRKYEEGNRAARFILFSSIEPTLAVSLFSETSQTVEAPEMFRLINDKFRRSNGGLKQLALSKLTRFKYDSNRTAGMNLLRFNQILSSLTGLGVEVAPDLRITILLDALPSSWELFKQGFVVRDEATRSLRHLMIAIETEALRRGKYDTNEITALFTRASNPRRRKPRQRTFNQQTSTVNRTVSRTSEVSCYGCGRQGHMIAQCRVPGRNQNTGQRQSVRPRRNSGGGRGRRFQQRTRQPQAQANISEARVAEAYIGSLIFFFLL